MSEKQKITVLIDNGLMNEVLKIKLKNGIKFKSEAIVHCIKLGIIADESYVNIDKELTKISVKYAEETTSLTEIVNNISNDKEHTFNKEDNFKDESIIFTDKGNREEEYAKQYELEKEVEENEYCNKNANCSSCEKQYTGCLHDNWSKSNTTPLEDIENIKQKIGEGRIIKENSTCGESIIVENIKALTGEPLEDIEIKTTTEIKEPPKYYKNNTNQMVLSKPNKFAKHNEEEKEKIGEFDKQLRNAQRMLTPLIKGYCENCKEHKVIIDKNGNTTGCTCNIKLMITHMKNCNNYSNPQIGECTGYKKMEVTL